MKILIASFLFFLTTMAHAQLTLPEPCRPAADDFKNWYDHKTVMGKEAGMTLNGQQYKQTVLGGGGIPKILEDVEIAKKSFGNAMIRKKMSFSLSILGGTFLGAGLAIQPYLGTSEERSVGNAMLFAGAGLSGIAVYQEAMQFEKENLAFWQFNRQQLAKTLVQNTSGSDCYDAFLKHYDEKTLYLSRFNTFTQGGKRYGNGLFLGNLKEKMSQSPSALEQIEKSNNNSWAYRIGTLTLLSVQGYGFWKLRDAQNLSRREFNKNIYILLGASLGHAFLTPFRTNAVQAKQRAVWYYNRDVLLRDDVSKNMDIIK
jgi:hypothetical protein